MSKTLPNNLVIALRYNGGEEHNENLEIYLNYLGSLSPEKILCATPRGNVGVAVMKKVGVDVREYENYDKNYFIKPVMDFYQYSSNSHLLMVSFGVQLEKWQLEHGFEFLRSRNLLSVGWRITQQENDGSYLGRLSYNTCLLHAPDYYERVMEAGGIPDYVENGSLGSTTIHLPEGVKEIRIGGQEDLAVQLRIYKSLIGKKHKLFGHIKHYGVDYLNEPPTNNGFNEKLIRKVITAEIYRKIEDVDPRDFLDSWRII